MKRFIRSQAGAASLWLVASLVLAAILSPWLYRGGAWLARVVELREVAGPVEWLGAACGRSLDNFGRYFDRSLLLAAMLLLPLLLARLRWLRSHGAQPVRPLRRLGPLAAGTQAASGFIIAALGFGLLACLLVANGAFVMEDTVPGFSKVLSKTIPPMLAASVVEEWLFRGLLLGLWLGCTGVRQACLGSSLMFSVMHFLNPPKGTEVLDPAMPWSGFELLVEILRHFTDPVFFITDFATLFVLGLLLAWSRIRTRSLWMAIGIHAALVGAFKIFNLLYRQVDGHSWNPWGVGDTLKSGLLPLSTLLLIWWAVAAFLRRAGERINPA